MLKLPNPNSQSAADRLKPLDNANPRLHDKRTKRDSNPHELNDNIRDVIDEQEVYDIIRNINDPEHPYTLEQLDVVKVQDVKVDETTNQVSIFFTPTIPHCSMATLIGLSIRVKLLRSLPPRFKVDVNIAAGTHASEEAVNKQLADKERVAAALENSHLLDVVNQCVQEKDEN